MLSLSRGLLKNVAFYNGYIVNGYRFHVEHYDKKLTTQNSGVVVLGDVGNGKDEIDYYGILTEVIEL